MRLRLLAGTFGILKRGAHEAFPAWLSDAPVFFAARTEDELSLMCPAQFIPPDVEFSAGYRCLRVDGDLAFDEVGVVARVSKPLADAGLSIFVVSTHDRDYVLIPQADLARAIDVYRAAGFDILDAV